MTEPSKPQLCGKCGGALGGYAPDGLCAACLLESAIEERDADSSPAPLLAFSDYELLEEIARGGMGVVYRARQISLKRAVAIKMILGGHLASAAELKRFRAEAETAAQLQHPNIVAIHEVGDHAGQPFFSMDLVEGRNLAQLVRDEPLPSRKAAVYLKTIAETVQYAHSRGVLHRDLKPSNILIDYSDQPRVTDFGLAKRLTSTQDSGLGTPDLTLTGQVLGSPSFIPPEQAAGQKDAIGPASDVYSLGAILYHCLTARPPFVAESLTQTLRMVAENDAVSPRLLNASVPRDLETICLKCLEKDSNRRYATAHALAAELGCFLEGKPIAARPVSTAGKAWRWCRRKPALAAVSVLALIMVVAVAVVSTLAALRLEVANREAREKLRESYLAQARANRWSGRPGRRFDSLDVIRQAAGIRPGIDLRNEAIAAMALVDVRPVKHWSVDHARQCYQVFDRSFARYLRTYTNGTITVHRTTDDRELMNWPGPGVPTVAADFSPDGRFLAAAWQTNSFSRMSVYDLAKKTVVSIALSDRWLRGARFSSDGWKLAVIVWTDEQKAMISIYDTANWQMIASFRNRTMPYGLDFDPNSERLAVGSVDSPNVEIRSTVSGDLIDVLTHSAGVHRIEWSPTGDVIATACADENIYLWDLSPSPPRARRLANGAVAPGLSFKRGGDLLVTADWNSRAKIWDVRTGKELLCWPVAALNDYTHTDDRWISCYSTWNRSELFELSTAEECQLLNFKASWGGSWSVAYSPDGRMLVSTHDDGLRIWDAASPRESVFIPHGPIGLARFARDGSGFISASRSELFWWPVKSNDRDGTNYITVGPAEQVSQEMPSFTSPTNRLMVAARNSAYLIDAASVRIERRIATPEGVHAAALSPDGLYCATWSLSAPVVEIWSANDGRRVTTLAAPHAMPFFSGDGRWIVTASADEYVFWESKSWIRRHSISHGLAGAGGRLDFSPDNRIVALAVGRSEVALFDVTTFARLATFEAPEANGVSGIAFSPDGTTLAVSTQGQEIRLWNLVAVRRQLAEMKLDYDLPPPLPASRARKPLKIIAAASPVVEPPRVFTPKASDFPVRDALCRTNQIDLTRFYNATLTNSWFNPKWENNDLSELPRGLQTLDGVQFDIRGVVQLSSSNPELAVPYPKEVNGIPVRQACRVIHFLHANGWSHAASANIGEYVLHYEDGNERTLSLVHAENIWNWWDSPGQTARMKPGTTLAWRGRNPLSDRYKTDLLLFHFRWENPRPDAVVSSITFRSRMTDCAPFLIAVTAE